MSAYRIAVLIGSLRRESNNRKLANALMKLVPAELELHQSRIDDLPLYNQDDDANQAAPVKRLKSEIEAAQGVIFVTAEYNRSVPGVLKNAIDHASRPYGRNSWPGKPTGVMGASPGSPGTSMAQQHLRNVLAHVDAPVMGQPELFFTVKEGFFGAEGEIASPDALKKLQRWIDRYLAWVQRFAG